MKNRLGVSSEEFLKEYTGILWGETGPPVLFLKMQDDDEKSCPFLGEEGCGVYEDRPGQCRIFPLKHVGAGNYIVEEDSNCLGLNEGKEWTLKEWKKEQGVDSCNELDDLFREISLNEELLKKNMQNDEILQMFLLAYEPDNFKRFVFDTKFLDIFDVHKKEVKRIKEDEAELLKFAIKWLKFGPIDKEALKTKTK
jgi:hypothetical protein